MSESSRHALVVSIEPRKHPDADALSIIEIDGFTVVINTEQWKGIERGCYILPETIVDVTRPEFSFLRRPDKNRDREVVTVRKFRGVWSQGLLVPVSNNIPVGTDLWDFYGLEHYEPVEDEPGLISGECSKAPPHWTGLSKYDCENYLKYSRLFQDGEPVNCLEKINGSNMSCVYSDGEYHVKSRNLWKKESDWSDFWRALNCNESIKEFLISNPNYLVQGELSGKVGGYSYGVEKGQVVFLAFDIRKPDYSYMNCEEFYNVCQKYNIRTPKFVGPSYLFPHNREQILQYAEGLTLENASHIREGIVVRSAVNRFEPKLNGRLILKLVSNSYLEKSNKK